MSELLKNIHHTAIICSDYDRSKRFYTEVLGLDIIRETWRAERRSWKLDLALNGHYIIELFSFPASSCAALAPGGVRAPGISPLPWKIWIW
jgi:glyoxylase I family protein